MTNQQYRFFMKKLIITLGLLTAIYSFPKTALADTTCTQLYGGGSYSTTCVSGELSVNKTVQNPTNNQFVDNLDNSTPFTPGQQVNFQITINNTGNATLNNIVVKDMLPNFLDYISSNGNFDNNSKTVTYNIDHLNSGSSQTFSVDAKFTNSNNLPSNTNTTCVVNQATATADGQPTAQDNSQACVVNNVLGATTKGGQTIFPAPNTKSTPPTGAEAFSLLALIPAVFAGLKLRKKSIRS